MYIREPEKIKVKDFIDSFPFEVYKCFFFTQESHLPAMVALSHPCNILPTAATSATRTAPLIFSGIYKVLLFPGRVFIAVNPFSNQTL